MCKQTKNNQVQIANSNDSMSQYKKLYMKASFELVSDKISQNG